MHKNTTARAVGRHAPYKKFWILESNGLLPKPFSVQNQRQDQIQSFTCMNVSTFSTHFKCSLILQATPFVNEVARLIICLEEQKAV